MKHIKKFNEEYYGGRSSDILVPRIDKIISELTEMKSQLLNNDFCVNQSKIETISNYLIDNMDLTMLATQERKSGELTGRKSKEGFVDKVKRSIDNF